MNSGDVITKCLDSSSYTNINHNIILGLDGDLYEAFMLSHLMGMYSYFVNMKMLNDGWFFQTIEDVRLNCGISESKQRSALSSLEAKGLISMRLLGSPPKRNFKLNTDGVVELFNMKPEIKPKLDKTEFYIKLNHELDRDNWSDSIDIGMIPKDIGFFMYEWKFHHTLIGSSYQWTPKYYGILRHYWRTRYDNKKFDYSSITEFFGDKRSHYSIESFLAFDRMRLELPDSEKYTYDNVLKEY